MRSPRAVAVAALVVGTLAGAPAAQAAGPLLGQWSFDGRYEAGGGLEATADGSGHGLDLKAPSGVLRVGAPGRFGAAALLPANASTPRVDSPILAPAQLTLLAWVKQSGAVPVLRYLAGRGDDGPGTCLGSSYALYTGYPGFAGLHFYVRTATTPGPSSVITPVISDAGWTDGQWHLLAGTFDGAKARLYIDGVLASESAESATAPIQYALGGGTTFYADGYPQASCGNADFPGALDELRLYDRALSASELGRLAASAGPAAPELISDASLLPKPDPMPLPAPVPAPAPGPGPVSPTAPSSSAKLADVRSLEAAAAGVAGASKKAPTAALVKAAEQAQSQALAALKGSAASSQVSKPEPVTELTAKELKGIKPDPRLQARLEAMRFGTAVEVPAAPGQVVEVVTTVALEKKAGGKASTQTIVLPPSVGTAQAGQKTAVVPVAVDGQATAAMAKRDVAKAAVSVQAVVVDSVAELGEVQSMKLQQALERRSKAMESLSNVLKKLSDTEQAITQNLRGGLTSSERKEQQRLKSKAEKLERDAKAIERGRDEASQKASEAMDAATTALIEAAIAAAGQVGGAAGATPSSTTALSGCRTCQLAALASK